MHRREFIQIAAGAALLEAFPKQLIAQQQSNTLLVEFFNAGITGVLIPPSLVSATYLSVHELFTDMSASGLNAMFSPAALASGAPLNENTAVHWAAASQSVGARVLPVHYNTAINYGTRAQLLAFIAANGGIEGMEANIAFYIRFIGDFSWVNENREFHGLRDSPAACRTLGGLAAFSVLLAEIAASGGITTLPVGIPFGLIGATLGFAAAVLC